MNLCFSTVGCPEWTWGEIVSAARDLGYGSVEIRGVKSEIYAPSIPQFSAEHIQKTRAQLEQLSLNIPCLSSDSMVHMRPYQERSRAEVRAYIDLAQAISTPFVRVMADEPRPHPAGPVDEGHVVEMLKPLCDEAASKGVTLLLETHGWYCDTRRLRNLIDRVEKPNLGVLWDIHHPYRFAGEKPAESMKNLRGLVRHVHVKDSTMKPDGMPRYAMAGYGDLPLTAFFDELRGEGYAGAYSLEWVRRWDLSLEAPGIVFAQYISYMNGL